MSQRIRRKVGPVFWIFGRHDRPPIPLLQLLDVGCFAVLKRAYGCLVENQVRLRSDNINKLDFLMADPEARADTFRLETIQNSFAAAGLSPINPESVLSKLNISLHTPTPSNSRPSSRSSVFTPKTPRTAIQLEKQAIALKDLLKQRSKSPPSPTKAILNQIVKGHYLALHNTALLAKEVDDLRKHNEKKRQKRSLSTRQIVHEGGFTGKDAIQVIQPPTQAIERVQSPTPTAVQQPILLPLPAKRAQPKCSGCGYIGPKINSCKNR